MVYLQKGGVLAECQQVQTENTCMNPDSKAVQFPSLSKTVRVDSHTTSMNETLKMLKPLMHPQKLKLQSDHRSQC